MNKLGLTEEQAIKSRLKYGSNNISEKKKNNLLKLFVESLSDPIIRILLIALCLKTLFLISSFDWYETIGIVIAILMASLVSTLSEYGSEASFRRLQEEASQMQCKVYRNGKLKQIYVGEVVYQDVALLQAGDKIVADGVLISGSIHVDESALNGEAKEMLKDKNNNKLYRGSIVCSDECKMLVTAVGDKTIYGNIALELQEDQRESPLKLKLRMLAQMISRFGYVGAALVSLSYLFNVIVIKNDFDIEKIKDVVSNFNVLFGFILHAITLAVTVIVVAVPEGLPMMIALVLSLNMKKMLKNNILVRKLIGIETSGGLNVLFTDKTGTITKGKLQVSSYINGSGKEFNTLSEIKKHKDLFRLLSINLIYNNAAYMEEKKAIGSNATDRALLEYLEIYKDDISGLKKENVVTFDSKTKISITKVSGTFNAYLIKGAPEKILPYCSFFYDENGQRKHLLNIYGLNKNIEERALKGFRFIALAVSDNAIGNDLQLKDLSLIGLLGIRDEVRKEASKAVELVERAGVQVVMITGDAKDTATSIAKEVGILKGHNMVLTSEELNKISDEDLKPMLSNIKVVARALPKDKSRLVHISQELGLVVGMTGDGVNDAPALKKADVGFAMGSGTEVAKEAADIVILDDNFLSISRAILFGRTIFKNIRKFIIFQLTINLCAVGLSIIGPFIGISMPITVIQMLWINMVMDTLAALAFAGEPPLKEYMEEKPKKRNEPVVNHYMKNQILVTGVYLLLLCLFFLKAPFIRTIFNHGDGDIYLMTAFFALFIFMSIFNSFNTRTFRLNLLAHIFKNKGFIGIMLFIIIVQIYLIYYGGNLFRVAGLSINEFWLVLVFAFSVIPVDWIRKLYLRFKNEKGGV